MASAPSNQFLERLNHLLDWEPIEVALWSMYPAKTSRPPHPPLVLFKIRCLHCKINRAFWRYWVEHDVAIGIMERGRRGRKLRAGVRALNLVLGRLRAQVEGVFGWMKHWAGYRRGRYQGLDPNRLELEFKSICWNLTRLVKVAAA